MELVSMQWDQDVNPGSLIVEVTQLAHVPHLLIVTSWCNLPSHDLDTGKTLLLTNRIYQR